MAQDNEKFIKFFKALSNEDRLQIIKLLHKNKELCAQEVEKHFYLEQSTTSHHLNTLKRAKITKSRKKGRHIFYSVDYENLKLILGECEDFILG
ncbi:transcriptional regulator [Candidatus Marinamargulisbacteria bacterium SCGC AG-439-L15]|nr:transcriptional regulator [Candidatus Marinamargulisbacteria bacterium SCGC AG-439-L15]